MSFYLPSEINEFTKDEFLFQLENAKEGDNVILTVCYGGAVSDALEIAMAIKKKRCNTIADFIVASAGVCIFSAGVNRTANSWTQFFLHQTQIPFYMGTNINKTTLGADYETLKTYDEVMAKFIATNIGADETEIMNLINNEGGNGTWFDVNLAIDLNLVTDVKVEESNETKLLVAKLNPKQETKEMNEPEKKEPKVDVSDLKRQLDAMTASMQEVQSLFAERFEKVEKRLDEMTGTLGEVKKQASIAPISPEFVDGAEKKENKPKSALYELIAGQRSKL
jgi:ATP-dependent protease ClpP protease subunit